MAHPPQPPSRISSLRASSPLSGSDKYLDGQDSASLQFSLYTGVSERPLGWKRSTTRNPEFRTRARNMNIRRWDGAARTSKGWDSLRKDPELWFSKGNCTVHLYGRGQSRRGPAFKMPIEALVETNCQPLMHRFLAAKSFESPSLSDSTNEDGDCFKSSCAELYIPAPPMTERGQAFLYHTATRNFFAWMFGKSLVGNHLGGALVGLLNSMNEFRSEGEDNVQAIMDYMDEEGYADMRNQPDHALAILFFAEHFQFRDLWIDAFAHCVGMHETLIRSPGFEFISRTSRALITRSKLEMDMRLDHCGRRLGTFLEDDLSDAHMGLSSAARAHLDRFRSFLQSHFVAKLGYFPPTSCADKSAAFPKNIYGQMASEFQKLYDFLVDNSVTAIDSMPIMNVSQQGGICVAQSVQAFDQRHKYQPLPHPFPLLPEFEECSSLKSSKSVLNKRFTWSKADKLKPDPRLVIYSAITKATNRRDAALHDCSLVRAYKSFEKMNVFNPDRNDKLAPTEARKIRWVLIYTILQTLLSVTRVPEQVRDTQNVPYNLCVLTAGCPPWKEERPPEFEGVTQTDQSREEYRASQEISKEEHSLLESIQPDIDYTAIHRHPLSRVNSESALTILTSGKGTVRRALSTLGNMPELHHPCPKRSSYHEILVSEYGNGTNSVSITTGRSADEEMAQDGKQYPGSASSSSEDLSSRWSNTSEEAQEPPSPTTSTSSDGTARRGLGGVENNSKTSIRDFLDRPLSTLGLRRVPSSLYSASVCGGESIMQPDPLQVKKGAEEHHIRVTKAVTVHWEKDFNGEGNDELKAYLHS